MYMEEFTATRALTEELAEEIMTHCGHYTSRITISCHDLIVNAPVLAVAWADLNIRPGDRVTITVESGHQPPDLEDRRALSDIAGLFRG
ncbi:HPr family phosphocarrier protein [Nocardia uniformis]|uniref:HPr family phosphocarrier protein n=1 Tax=Nocardia uniformis TaxID=53432 RepID=A0A849C9L4_9NOCA|nr:HPr family phosphocarrier protein [Nocardia uniformis]NNH75503.1 HPr family phosphocarrier protein [Nocardia uniformis]